MVARWLLLQALNILHEGINGVVKGLAGFIGTVDHTGPEDTGADNLGSHRRIGGSRQGSMLLLKGKKDPQASPAIC